MERHRDSVRIFYRTPRGGTFRPSTLSVQNPWQAGQVLVQAVASGPYRNSSSAAMIQSLGKAYLLVAAS